MEGFKKLHPPQSLFHNIYAQSYISALSYCCFVDITHYHNNNSLLNHWLVLVSLLVENCFVLFLIHFTKYRSLCAKENSCLHGSQMYKLLFVSVTSCLPRYFSVARNVAILSYCEWSKHLYELHSHHLLPILCRRKKGAFT